MKHSSFLKTLKTLKSRLQLKQKKHSPYQYLNEKKKEDIYCTCTDSHGEAKYLYRTKKELEYILSSKSISLTTYPCPDVKGWHLTKGSL